MTAICARWTACRSRWSSRLAAATPEEALKIRADYANTPRERGSGVRAGQSFAFDEVIDPAKTRDRIFQMLRLSRGASP